MPRFPHWMLSLLAALCLTVPVLAEQDCPKCTQWFGTISGIEAELARYKNLLAANQKFLAGPEGKDPSKATKVRSNILVLLLKVETASNNLTAEQAAYKKACWNCPRPK